MRIPGLSVAVFLVGIYKKVAVARIRRIIHIRPAAGFSETLFIISHRHMSRRRIARHGGLRNFLYISRHQAGQVVRWISALVFAVIGGDGASHFNQFMFRASFLPNSKANTTTVIRISVTVNPFFIRTST